MKIYEPDKLSLLVAKMVKDGQLPQYLYCYMSINRMDWIEDLLLNCHLWFSAPTEFNDPFDCKVYPEIPNDEELADYLYKNVTNVYPPNYEIIKQGLKDRGKEIAIQAIDNVINKSGIKCFTDRNDCILMWSHYANCHRGICLKFDVLEDPSFFVYPLAMDYRKDYPRMKFTDKRFTSTLLKTKYSDWSYEHEYRVYKQTLGYHGFYHKALKAIILGCSAKEETVSCIREIVSGNPQLSHVRFNRAYINSTSFKLDIGNLPI